MSSSRWPRRRPREQGGAPSTVARASGDVRPDRSSSTAPGRLGGEPALCKPTATPIDGEQMPACARSSNRALAMALSQHAARAVAYPSATTVSTAACLMYRMRAIACSRSSNWPSMALSTSSEAPLSRASCRFSAKAASCALACSCHSSICARKDSFVQRLSLAKAIASVSPMVACCSSCVWSRSMSASMSCSSGGCFMRLMMMVRYSMRFCSELSTASDSLRSKAALSTSSAASRTRSSSCSACTSSPTRCCTPSQLGWLSSE
mmetsp:Transcript_12618/g.46090  ORF Transcript_12618/g.46090 Transcript_12618/m.46090 type:complete len:264 (-) Transcript_12618:330-1121(-)